MKHMYDDVLAFHTAFGAVSAPRPTWPSKQRWELRRKLIAEETGEMWMGFARRDMVAVADGLADSLYVLVGTLIEAGLPLNPPYSKIVPNGPPAFPDILRVYEIRGIFFYDQSMLWRSEVLARIGDHLNEIINKYIGLANELHLPLPALWEAVHRTNMAKLHRATHLECEIGPSTKCTCGAVLYREDGKILKPPSWAPPDIEGILEAAGYVPLAKRPPVPPYEPNKS